MAEGKRQSGGGKVPVATPNIGSTAAVSLETALGGAIGARIRISTIPPHSQNLEGILHTVDPITNLLALNTAPPPPTPLSASTPAQPADYRILPISRISSLQILSLPLPPSPTEPQSFTTAQPTVQALDLRPLKGREAAAIAKLRERESRRGKGVSKDAQDIFDAFHKTLPTRWDGINILVNDSIIIEPPYGVNECRLINGGENQALSRVKKVLAMEKDKIELKKDSSRMNAGLNAAARVAVPAAGAGARKGG